MLRVFEKEKHIERAHASGPKILAEIIPTLGNNVVFFLDAQATETDLLLGKGPVDVPKIEELRVINEHFKGTAVIIMNNARLFGLSKDETDSKTDWSPVTKQQIAKSLSGRVEAEFEMHDKNVIKILVSQVKEKSKKFVDEWTSIDELLQKQTVPKEPFLSA